MNMMKKVEPAAVHRALIEMMRQVETPEGMDAITREVSGAVVPFSPEERANLAKMTRAAVLLLAGGLSVDDAVGALSKAVDKPVSGVERVARAVWRAGEQRALTEKSFEDPSRTVRIARSYHDMIAGRAGPSEELTEFAISIGGGEPDYNEAGRRAMLGMLDAVLAPVPHLTSEFVELAAELNRGVERAAMSLVNAGPDDMFGEARTTDKGVEVTVMDGAGNLHNHVFGESSSETPDLNI